MNNYVIDTNSLINFHYDLFKEKRRLSAKAVSIIEKAFNEYSTIRISIPSIVFVEIYRKKFVDEETSSKFRTIYKIIKESPNFEIKTIDKEVLENYIKIDHTIVRDNHDKLVLASAMMLSCPLISYDSKIIKYVKSTDIIPDIIF